jgi:hypothetical protein
MFSLRRTLLTSNGSILFCFALWVRVSPTLVAGMGTPIATVSPGPKESRVFWFTAPRSNPET